MSTRRGHPQSSPVSLAHGGQVRTMQRRLSAGEWGISFLEEILNRLSYQHTVPLLGGWVLGEQWIKVIHSTWEWLIIASSILLGCNLNSISCKLSFHTVLKEALSGNYCYDINEDGAWTGFILLALPYLGLQRDVRCKMWNVEGTENWLTMGGRRAGGRLQNRVWNCLFPELWKCTYRILSLWYFTSPQATTVLLGLFGVVFKVNIVVLQIWYLSFLPVEDSPGTESNTLLHSAGCGDHS